MSRTNTNLPCFIDAPREMLPRGVAESTSAVQIETKKIRRLCASDQQFTGFGKQNVGTLLFAIKRLSSLVGPESCQFRYMATAAQTENPG
jgi:hypothetical protein